MDPNLLIWKTEGRSFFSRLQTWFSLLDPTLLLASEPEIQKTHTLLGRVEQVSQEDEPAVILSLSSVHPDSGAPLPILFRPPAVFPLSSPLVVASLLPHSTVKPALFWQLLLQSYYAGFNFTHRSSSSEQQGAAMSPRQLLLMAGTVSFTACAAALPQIFIQRLNIRSPPVQTFCRSVLPIPLSAALAFFSVFTIRSEEAETGVQVFDQQGNLVGVSKAAGTQAVRDTALSRAALFGTTAAFPNLLLLLLNRTRLIQRNSLLLAPLRHVSAAMFLGLMLPVSFSLFPQLGTVRPALLRSAPPCCSAAPLSRLVFQMEAAALETELQAGAAGGNLFYHRGL